MDKKRRKHLRMKMLSLANVFSYNSIKLKDKVAIKNISMGGLAFVSDVLFCQGDHVIFNFLFTDLNLVGMVNRVNKNNKSYYYGVQFKNISIFNGLELSKLMYSMCDNSETDVKDSNF